MSFDLWFWKPSSEPTRAADDVYRWCSETETEYVDAVGKQSHNRFVLKGAIHSEIAPFDPAQLFLALRDALPSASEADDAPILDLVLQGCDGPAAYGDVSFGWSQVERFAGSFITAVTRAGFTVYDPQSDRLHPACFGERFWLEVEDRWRPVHSVLPGRRPHRLPLLA